MSDIRSALATLWESMRGIISTVSLSDVLDILIVAFLIYQAVRLVRETRAMQLVKGIVLILVMYVLALNLNLTTLSFIITNILQWGIVALAIVFQPELRRALEQVGRSKLSSSLFRETEHGDNIQVHKMLDSVCAAAVHLSERNIGALMVLERETKLGDVIATGTIIDSEPTTELICNIFFPNSPLHDGAMVLRSGRLHAAGCFLPLSSNDEIGRELGTRHRAALGMSEVSDAVVVVVSEETGAISVALNGRLQRNLSAQNLTKLLEAKMFSLKAGEASPVKERGFWRIFR
ncbi:MAG: diadenylate cyclase CdaA [Oscillospiraceae bacterium]